MSINLFNISYCIKSFEYVGFLNDFNNSNYEVEVGRIYGFKPFQGNMRKSEVFYLNDKKFIYSPYSINSAFNDPDKTKGAIHDGVLASVIHVDGKILKFELMSAGAK